MNKSYMRLYGIRSTYGSDVRSSHATIVYKIDDLFGVQYGIRMLMEAMQRLESNADGQRRLTAKGLCEDVAVWMEFILLRFEMHTGDEGDYGYQEYAEKLTEAEREQFLKARQLRRSHIQHLSAKWLRKSTLVLDVEDEDNIEAKKILLGFSIEGADRKMTRNEIEFDIPPGKQLQLPFFAVMDLNFGCLDWEVFSGGVDKILECLQRDLRNLQSKLVAEINNLSKDKRAEILMCLNQAVHSNPSWKQMHP